jgi:hypothetical protein
MDTPYGVGAGYAAIAFYRAPGENYRALLNIKQEAGPLYTFRQTGFLFLLLI